MKQFRHKTIDIEDINGKCLRSSILRTMAYFNIFHYPLCLDEILEYTDQKEANSAKFEKELIILQQEGIVKKSGDYYYLGNESFVHKRLEANRYSERLMQKALKYAKLISNFPFVKSISISGSLSKKSADQNADVDYFIITQKNRLWICRTMLAIFKKIFLFNSSKYFCINYFVDTENLEIKEKNIYTATEIAFLIPVYNYENFFRFIESNSWINIYYPHKRIEINENIESEKDSKLKRTLERLLEGKTGNALDNFFLIIYQSYKNFKFKRLTLQELEKNLKSTKGVSKHHPNSYQETVLSSYRTKLDQINSMMKYELN